MKIKVKNKKTNKVETYSFDEKEYEKMNQWRKQQEQKLDKTLRNLWK